MKVNVTLLLLILMTANVVGAFHHASCIAMSDSYPSRAARLPTLGMRAMRLPRLSSPRKAQRLLWVFSSFLKNLGLSGVHRLGQEGNMGGHKRRDIKRRMASNSWDVAQAHTITSAPQAMDYSMSSSVGVALESSSASAGGGDQEQDNVPILIKYTGGVGYKSLYVGVCKVLKENFGNISIRKTILAATEQRGSKKLGTFEVIVGDESFSSKQGAGVYLPMADIQSAIERLILKREKENRALAAAASTEDGNPSPQQTE